MRGEAGYEHALQVSNESTGAAPRHGRLFQSSQNGGKRFRLECNELPVESAGPRECIVLDIELFVQANAEEVKVLGATLIVAAGRDSQSVRLDVVDKVGLDQVAHHPGVEEDEHDLGLFVGLQDVESENLR